MKKYISIILALLISTFIFIPVSAEEVTAKPFNSADEGTVWEVYDDDLLSDYITSEDRLWEYQIVKKDNSALPYEYFGKNITVLEIPEEIDGHPVTVKNRFICDSPCLSRIILPATIKEISNMYLDSRKKSNNTIFTVNLNEGLKKINKGAGSYEWDALFPAQTDEINTELKLLVFPESLAEIEEFGLLDTVCEKYVIQSDPIVCRRAFSQDDFIEYQTCGEDDQFPKNHCEHFDVYYTGNALNSDSLAYSFERYEHELDDLTFPFDVTVYHKPHTEGFEKFDTFRYTFKEYTDEWWNDIKEIESVTLSGTGLTENAEVTQKLSESELKWMDKEYSLNMKSGEKVKLSGTFAPSDAFDNRMFFVSLDEDVVKADVDSGEVTALKKGTATVRCVAASGVFSDVVISVDGGGMSEKTSTADTTVTSTSTETASSPAKDNAPTKDKTPDVKPVYIIAPACAAIIAAAAIVVVKKKKK